MNGFRLGCKGAFVKAVNTQYTNTIMVAINMPLTTASRCIAYGSTSSIQSIRFDVGIGAASNGQRIFRVIIGNFAYHRNKQIITIYATNHSILNAVAIPVEHAKNPLTDCL